MAGVTHLRRSRNLMSIFSLTLQRGGAARPVSDRTDGARAAAIRSERVPNQAVQPTGASRLGQRQVERHRQLAPMADLPVGRGEPQSSFEARCRSTRRLLGKCSLDRHSWNNGRCVVRIRAAVIREMARVAALARRNNRVACSLPDYPALRIHRVTAVASPRQHMILTSNQPGAVNGGTALRFHIGHPRPAVTDPERSLERL